MRYLILSVDSYKFINLVYLKCYYCIYKCIHYNIIFIVLPYTWYYII